MKISEQRTPLDYIREWLMPIVVAAFGWYMSSLISEIRGDVKTLLDTKAHQIEQIRSLERAIFGKTSEPDEDFSYNYTHKEFNQFLFDKAKTLQYENGKFIYS